MTIALDTSLNEELILEGFAREIVNKVNTMRRDQKFAVSDRIQMTIDTTARIKQAYEIHREWICGEVLATTVSFRHCQGVNWDLNGEAAMIEISKIPM